MSPMEVVIEELQTQQRIPGDIALGEGVRLAGERIEPIAQGAVESFDMDRASWLHARPYGGAGLHRQQSSVLIAMLDGFRQRDRLGNDQRRTPPFACQHPLAIGPHEDVLIALPPITEPVQLALVGPLDRGGHRVLD